MASGKLKKPDTLDTGDPLSSKPEVLSPFEARCNAELEQFDDEREYEDIITTVRDVCDNRMSSSSDAVKVPTPSIPSTDESSSLAKEANIESSDSQSKIICEATLEFLTDNVKTSPVNIPEQEVESIFSQVHNIVKTISCKTPKISDIQFRKNIRASLLTVKEFCKRSVHFFKLIGKKQSSECVNASITKKAVVETGNSKTSGYYSKGSRVQNVLPSTSGKDQTLRMFSQGSIDDVDSLKSSQEFPSQGSLFSESTVRSSQSTAGDADDEASDFSQEK